MLIKDVGPEISTGLVLYSSVKPGPDTQLREIPRRGVDAAFFLHFVNGPLLRVLGDGTEVEASGNNIMAGIRIV